MTFVTNQHLRPSDAAPKVDDDSQPATSNHERIAVLYQGQVAFAYASGQRNAIAMNSARAKQMAAALARRRTASGKYGPIELDSVGDMKADAADTQCEPQPVSHDDGRQDGRRQQHGFPAEFDIEIELAAKPTPTFPPSEIQRPHESQRLATPHPQLLQNGEKLLETSIRTLLDLRDALAQNPYRSVGVDVYTCLINMTSTYRCPSSSPAISIPKLHDIFHRVVAERAPSNSADGTRSVPPERAQDFNALLGLFILNTCRPSPPMQHQNAIVRLLALRRAALMRSDIFQEAMRT
ncbi:hypothetical protein [Burkholderia ubonensis]|uniref:hypothetical protein n=1 Tax=Burkholderia ubonensis TaxID=101571 RepID=UPI0012FCE73E|nr:hypothetical protein [Burkholderia ubonensis]